MSKFYIIFPSPASHLPRQTNDRWLIMDKYCGNCNQYNQDLYNRVFGYCNQHGKDVLLLANACDKFKKLTSVESRDVKKDTQ